MGKLWQLLQSHIDGEKYPPSERQVAAKLGVSPTTLGNWRAPRKLPSRENLQAIADLIGSRYSVVLDAALYDTGYHESASVVPLRRRPVAIVLADLRGAEQDLAELPDVAGAERKRGELQRRVDALKTELAASRAATGESDSVAEL